MSPEAGADRGADRPWSASGGKWPFLAAVAAGVALDLWSKAAAFAAMPPLNPEGPIRWVAGRWLGLTQTWNPGAVWGLGGSYPGVLLVVRLGVLLLVLVYVIRMRGRRPFASLALGLISAGAVGNLYDNLHTRPGGFTWDLAALIRSPGRVRDFIHVDLGFWPADPWPDFNAADAMILTGVALLVLVMPGSKAAAPQEAARGEAPPG